MLLSLANAVHDKQKGRGVSKGAAMSRGGVPARHGRWFQQDLGLIISTACSVLGDKDRWRQRTGKKQNRQQSWVPEAVSPAFSLQKS